MTTPTPTTPAPIALVTGASRGLGKSTVLNLAKTGHDIVLTYLSREAEALEVVAAIEAKGRKALAIQLDVSDATRFEAFATTLATALPSHFGHDRLQVLVNNAGFGAHGTLANTTPAQFDALFNVHLKGPYFLTQQLLPLLADGARIVNISSGLTRFALPGYSAYAAMKGAVEVLSRYMAKELGARGIAVNTVAPGAIATDFGGGAVRDNAQLNSFVATQTALGRVGETEDIGPMIASLVSTDNRWINAQRIEVSGGMFV